MNTAPTFTIELTLDEGNSLLQLLDAAIKSQGLNVALSAVMFAQRIKSAGEKLNSAPPKE